MIHFNEMLTQLDLKTVGSVNFLNLQMKLKDCAVDTQVCSEAEAYKWFV